MNSASPFLDTQVKDSYIKPFTYYELQRHLLLGEEILKDAYEIQRVMASQVVVYLLADLNRFWKNEQPHAIPVLFFYRGYSMSMDITRQITETCKAACRSEGLDVVACAADGEFIPLIVRGRNGNPLTQHRLSKDIWKEVCQMTKSQIIKYLLNITKEFVFTSEEMSTCDTENKTRLVQVARSKDGALSSIHTPAKGWTQHDNNKRKQRLEQPSDVVEDIEVDEEGDSNEHQDRNDLLENDQILDENEENGGDAEPNNFLENLPKPVLNVNEILKALTLLNNDKWSKTTENELVKYFETAESLKRFTVKELIAVTQCVCKTFPDEQAPLNTHKLKNMNW